MIGSAKAESQSGCAALGGGRLRHPFRDAGDAPFQHRRADHPGIGADEGRPARRQAQRGSNFLKAVRLPSDTTSPKADISTWPEADIFIWLLQS